VSVVFLFILTFATTAFATQLHVPGTFGTIQEALDATSASDTVLVERGTYYELLVTPEHSVTLASNYIFSADTTDIQETLLDGYNEGTVITVATEWPWVFTLRGFTVQHGRGEYFGFGTQKGAAFHLEDNVGIHFEDIVFRFNTGVRSGAVSASRAGVDQTGDFNLKNIHIHDNYLVQSHPPGGTPMHTWLGTEGSVFLESIRIGTTTDSRNGHWFGGGDLSAQSLHASGITVSENGILSLYSVGTTTVRDVWINNCTSMDDGFLNISGDTTYARNIHIFDTHNIGTEEGNRGNYNSVAGGVLFADSIYLHHNTSLMGRAVGSVGGGHSFIRHLNVTDNVLGDSTVFYGNEYGVMEKIIGIGGCQIFDSEFSRNTILVAAADGMQVGCSGVLTGPSCNQDTVRIVNCVFRDNFIFDGDDYSTIANPEPNTSRALGISKDFYTDHYFEMRDCQFINNRQPNHAPEHPGMDWGHRAVGNTVKLSLRDHGGRALIINNLIQDNDDGGLMIRADHMDRVDIENLQVIRTKRQGLEVETLDTLSIRNCLFEEIVEQDMNVPYPFENTIQSIVKVGAGYLESMSNITMIGCTTTVAILSDEQFTNCIFRDNSFDYLYSPYWGEPQFSYSLVQEGMPGVGNVVADPLFDIDEGVPYLSSDSPCIDAGDPATAYNDIEDPGNPGFALWPSQGALRNDIGYTGGPRAAIVHFVDVPDLRDEPTIPQSITLGEPYPNPFNPSTQIPFILLQPAELELTIYDLLGREVATIAQGPFAAGTHEVRFHADELASGVYLVALRVDGEQVSTRKMLLLK
jgi:hypothetical protein